MLSHTKRKFGGSDTPLPRPLILASHLAHTVSAHPNQNQRALQSVDVASLRITVSQVLGPLRDLMSLRRADSPPAR